MNIGRKIELNTKRCTVVEQIGLPHPTEKKLLNSHILLSCYHFTSRRDPSDWRE